MSQISLTIAYDGTDFSGYELQPGKRTIRGELEKALLTLYKRKIRVSAVSRTDAGVHAVGAAIGFRVGAKKPGMNIVAALNSVLPSDIRVIRAGNGPQRPIGAKRAKKKEYQYLIYNGDVMPPHLRNVAWHVKPKLKLAAMRQAAKYFVGKHDFTSFSASGGADMNYNKTIHSLEIGNWSLVIWRGYKLPVIGFKIIGDGFLYKMVRNIVGTLVEVGLGRTGPAAVKKILEAKDRRRAGRTAPAQGLCLVAVS